MTEAAELVEDAVELADDTADFVGEHISEVVEVARTNPWLLVAAGVGGVAVGSVATYFIVEKKLRLKYEALMDEEVRTTREFYQNLHKVDANGKKQTPADVVENRMGREALDALKEYQPTPVEQKAAAEAAMTEKKAEAVVSNIFDQRSSAEITDEEIQSRSAEQPYIISIDEFTENPDDHDQLTVTFYENDGVLADDQDMPADIEDTVGEDNMSHFGHGSGQKHVVYIRNEVLHTDFEVTKSDMSFAKAMGFDDDEDELKHSAPRRFRGHDD